MKALLSKSDGDFKFFSSNPRLGYDFNYIEETPVESKLVVI